MTRFIQRLGESEHKVFNQPCVGTFIDPLREERIIYLIRDASLGWKLGLKKAFIEKLKAEVKGASFRIP